uniref:Uncharacterized protein n=1 Tax=Oryza glumipatula TaxID=40148 RepID=A0A0D9YQ39_9ORYZ
MTMRGDCCADKAVLGEEGRGRGHPQRRGSLAVIDCDGSNSNIKMKQDMSMKVLADDRTPKDSCKFTVTPGPCFPMLCLTYCHAQVAAISTGKCTPEGCQCTYCLPSPPLDKTN